MLEERIVKIIFSDIDGTLINSELRVTETTKVAIREAVAQGKVFVPVSARMPEAIQPIIDSIGITGPLIAFNGALVQGEQGDVVASYPMATDLALEICEYVAQEAPAIAWNVYSFHDWYSMDRTHPWVTREEGIVQLESQEATVSELSDLEAIHKLLLMGEPSQIAPLEVQLKKKYPSVSIVQSAPYFIEVMAKGIRKGPAVKLLADSLGISMEEAIAFGDNYNDEDMLETVGKGYLMGNAPLDLQKRIGNITADHNHDGIAQVLTTYL